MLKALTRDFGRFSLAGARTTQVESRRGLPARGTKPKPRNLWDQNDLQEKTGGKYTWKPLQINRLGGRDPMTGRKVNQHIGGGVKFDFFIIDFHRRGPVEEGQFYEERVLEVRRDPNVTPYIALVAGAKGKRWILATENMKAGQIIETSQFIPENPLVGAEGNAYPLGALAPGSIVNSVERFPTSDSEAFVREAGACATVVRHQGENVVIRLPHKHEFALSKYCMATVGRLSHADIKQKQFGSAQMHRWGYKMASGLWHKKDGYCGRKIRPLPPVKTLESEPPPREKIHFTITKDELSGHFGTAKVHNLLQAGHTHGEYPD